MLRRIFLWGRGFAGTGVDLVVAPAAEHHEILDSIRSAISVMLDVVKLEESWIRPRPLGTVPPAGAAGVRVASVDLLLNLLGNVAIVRLRNPLD